MKIVKTVPEVREAVLQAKAKGQKVGLVPTMGFLHEGHLTLMRTAKKQCDFVVASVFVNPTQFSPTEDYASYPRDLNRDAKLAEGAGVNLIFAPSPEEMYPKGFTTSVEVGGVSQVLEGVRRPIHFRGVATVVTKLFNIVQPDFAYFGQKDYQQLQVIRRMVADLNMPLQIVPVPIVREEDGLARSSRNTYLNEEERKQALVLSKALAEAEKMAASGEQDPKKIQDALKTLIESAPSAEVDYIAIVDPDEMTDLDLIEKTALVALAVKVGKTRLIDNRIIHVK